MECHATQQLHSPAKDVQEYTPMDFDFYVSPEPSDNDSGSDNSEFIQEGDSDTQPDTLLVTCGKDTVVSGRGRVAKKDDASEGTEGNSFANSHLQGFQYTEQDICWTGAWNSNTVGGITQPITLNERVDLNWNTEWTESLLRAQAAMTTSVVVTGLTRLRVLLPDCIHRTDLEKLEKIIRDRINEQRAVFIRKRRHQRTILVDSKAVLKEVLGRLEKFDHSKPQTIIDFEGLNFKRTGTVDIMELFVCPEDKLYLIDVVALKQSAWTITATTSKFSLKTFLSSSDCKKIMWDLRMDAHIMNKLYGVRLAGIIDCSLWTVAYRQLHRSNADNRISIEHACREILRYQLDPSELASLKSAKEERSRLPPRPWAIRPLPVALVDYSADVKFMGIVYDVLSRRLSKNHDVIAAIEYFTEKDLEIASDFFWDYASEREPYSPWRSGHIERQLEYLQYRREYVASQTRFKPRMSRFFASRKEWVWQVAYDFWVRSQRLVSRETT